MEEAKKISIMGMSMTFQILQDSEIKKPDCPFLHNGGCDECTCNECSSGVILRRDSSGWINGQGTCDCVNKAINRIRVKKSGLGRLSEKYTFENYRTNTEWDHQVRCAALNFLRDWKGNWFFVGGQSGSGKTHISVAICSELVKKGASVIYMKWTDVSTDLKACVNDPDKYHPMIDKYLNAKVLLIDDLFKQSITDADIRLAYQILNSRYNDGLCTIISSERTMREINNARNESGEALAGRIYEMTVNGRYLLELKGKEKNRRYYPR